MRKKKSYLIVGLGRLGISLCEKLADLEQSVVGVDRRSAPVAEISDKIDVAAQIDVTDESALIKVGAKEVDVAVVTIGESVEDSVMVTSILKDLGIPMLLARAASPLHAKILVRVGADKIVFPEYDMGRRIGENLVYPWYSMFKKVGGGTFMFGKVAPLPDMVGKTLADVKFHQSYDAVVVLIDRDGKEMLPSPDTPIQSDDKLWVLGRKKHLSKLTEKMTDVEELGLYERP